MAARSLVPQAQPFRRFPSVPSAPSREAGCKTREHALPEQAKPWASRARQEGGNPSQILRTGGGPASRTPSRKRPRPGRGGRRGMEFRERWADAADYNSQRPLRQQHGPGRGAPPLALEKEGGTGARRCSRVPPDFGRCRLPARGSKASKGGRPSPAVLAARGPREKGLMWHLYQG